MAAREVPQRSSSPPERFVVEVWLVRLAAAALPAGHSGAVRRVRAMAVVKIGGRM